MLGTIFLLSLGGLILIPSVWGTFAVMPSIIQLAIGNGDRYDNGCPMVFPCTPRDRVEAGWWAFLFDAIGAILIGFGARRIVKERRKDISQ